MALSSRTPPKGLLSKAVNDALKNWPLLTLRYLFDRIPFATTEADYEALLPQNLTQTEIENFTGWCS